MNSNAENLIHHVQKPIQHFIKIICHCVACAYKSQNTSMSATQCMNIIISRKKALPIPISFIVVKKISDCNRAIIIQNIATGSLRNFGIQSIGNNLFIVIKHFIQGLLLCRR